MNGQKDSQAQERSWDRAKMMITIIDAVTRVAELLLRR